jgi:hypothetical protein
MLVLGLGGHSIGLGLGLLDKFSQVQKTTNSFGLWYVLLLNVIQQQQKTSK